MVEKSANAASPVQEKLFVDKDEPRTAESKTSGQRWLSPDTLRALQSFSMIASPYKSEVPIVMTDTYKFPQDFDVSWNH